MVEHTVTDTAFILEAVGDRRRMIKALFMGLGWHDEENEDTGAVFEQCDRVFNTVLALHREALKRAGRTT
jgi:hypothetical protein